MDCTGSQSYLHEWAMLGYMTVIWPILLYFAQRCTVELDLTRLLGCVVAHVAAPLQLLLPVCRAPTATAVRRGQT